MQDEFVKVGGFEKMWNITQTGSAAKGNVVHLPATEKSWGMGWYIGSREVVIGKDTHIVHKMKMVEIGNPEHNEPIADKEKGELREFFGTTVLNDTLSKIIPGQFIRIQYLGTQQPKNQNGRPYKGWDVGISKTRPMLTNFESSAPVSNEIKGNASTETTANTAVAEADGDDDLPF